jgi:hypothetical protein
MDKLTENMRKRRSFERRQFVWKLLGTTIHTEALSTSLDMSSRSLSGIQSQAE